MFRKIREKIEEKAFSIQLKKGIKEPSTFDAMAEKFSVGEIKDIINQVEAEYNNGWIPCSERLPEDDATVWVTYIDNRKELTATAYYDLESGYWYVGYFDYKTKSVTHWQPLPQPPKGE